MEILEILIAITFTETTEKKSYLPCQQCYTETNIMYFCTDLCDEDNCGILSDITGGRNVTCCGLKSCSKHKYFYYPSVKPKIPSVSIRGDLDRMEILH